MSGALTEEQKAAIKARFAAARKSGPGGVQTHVVQGPTGIVPLSELSPDRSSFLLVGPPGVGKSVASVTFGGGEYGRVLYMLVEHGQEGGAGGATPLKFLEKETGVAIKEVDVLPVTSWAHAQTQYTWLVDNVRMLWEERKIRVIVIDGFTELASMVEAALVSLSPTQIGAKGDNQRDAVNSYVRDITGLQGRQMEKADFGALSRHVLGFGARMKFLPFRVVGTALEGDMYGATGQTEESRPIGVGPDLPGKKIVQRVCAQFDFVFHVERQVVAQGPNQPKGEKYVFLTANDPRLNRGFYAKTRGGYSLDKYMPAIGRGVLNALGFESKALDAPLPAPEGAAPAKEES